MKRVLKIFVHDLVGLSRNIFALIIAVGLCIIPSLYAWFNIYSNWDPYANTSSIKVAVVSQDAGYKNSDGKNVNMGEEVLDTLRKNTGLGWQILGTYDEAIDGVKSGKLWYGTGLVAGAFTGWTYAYFRLSWLESHLHIHIFCNGSILKMSHGKRPAGKVYTKSETVEESK